MKHKIEGAPSFSHVHVELDPGERIITESGAMASMDTDISHLVKTNGGILPALARKFFGKESFFINHYRNVGSAGQRIVLTQKAPGDIISMELDNSDIYLQPGAFIACTPGVNLSLKWAGFRSWFAREGLFRLHIAGKGTLWFGGYGRIIERDLNGEYLVDSSHVIGYNPGIEMHVQLAGGLFSSFFSGEGFVTRMVGKGKIYMQSRSLTGLAHWVNPKL